VFNEIFGEADVFANMLPLVMILFSFH